MPLEYVWYVTYGSNLLKERFRLYISGGRLKHTNRFHCGCRDSSPPVKESPITVPHELYFSGESRTWGGGGVAFIKSRRDDSRPTMGRGYLITREQFTDITLQENGRDPRHDSVHIDFPLAKAQGFFFIGGQEAYRWYGRVIYIDEREGWPIYTFTAKWSDENISCTKPGDLYLTTIVRGLRETFGLNNRQIFDYLSPKCGIKNLFSTGALHRLIASANGE